MRYVDITNPTIARDPGQPPVVIEHYDLSVAPMPEGWREVTEAEYAEYAVYFANSEDHFAAWGDEQAADRAGRDALGALREDLAKTVSA